MAAAARLGYRGNWAASTLATRRSHLVGLIVEPLPDATLRATLPAVEAALAQSGYACLFAVPSHTAEHLRTSAAMLARGVEAVIYAGVYPGTEGSEALVTRGVPWVAVGEDEGDDPRWIPLGRTAGGELAARYVLELGHERLGVVARDHGWARGVARASAQRTATLSRADVADADPNAVKLAILALLHRADRPTAILCSGDTEALIALRECVLLGLRVPEEISIVGFGDEAFAPHTVPALTTVRGSPREIGRRVAGAVLALLQQRAREPFKPPVKLVIRESAGPALRRSVA